MQCTEHHATRARLSQPLAAAALSAAALFLLPVANAQMNPPQARPQAQSPQAQSPQAQSPEVQSPSPTISDQKLSAAAAAIGQVATIRHSYESRIAEAPPSDQERLTGEANDALEKAVTDQGLSVDEYNTIIKTAQNNAAIRQKLAQRIPHSGQ
jgi:predicted ATPase with chaperone activity